MEGDRTAPSIIIKTSSFRGRTPSCIRPRRDGCGLFCAPYGVSVECARSDGHLFIFVCAPTISSMGCGGRIPEDVGERTHDIRPSQEYRLGVAIHGRSDDKVPARGGKNAVPIPPTGQNKGQNGVCSLKETGFRSALRSPVRTRTTSRWSGKLLQVSRSNDRNRHDRNRKAHVSTRDTIMMKCARSSRSSAIPRTFALEEKKHKTLKRKPGRKQGDGWWSEHIHG